MLYESFKLRKSKNCVYEELLVVFVITRFRQLQNQPENTSALTFEIHKECLMFRTKLSKDDCRDTERKKR